MPDFGELIAANRSVAVVLCSAAEKLLAVVFWFVLLGPAGALLYGTLCVLRDLANQQENSVVSWQPAIMWLHRLLSFVPHRLTALGYTLVGNFEASFSTWRENALKWGVDGDEILIQSGEASLSTHIAAQGESANYAAQSLVERASFVWLIAILVTYIG